MNNYVKLIATDLDAADQIITHFKDQEFDVTQHGCGHIIKIHGQSLKVVESHLASAQLDHLLAYDPVEK